MPESDIKQVYIMLTELKATQARMQADITYTRETMDTIQSENKERDRHIHQLEISKREARAIAGFVGFISGLAVPVVLWALSR